MFKTNLTDTQGSFITEKNQLEDPRQQWRKEQELMLKDYLVTAQDDLEVRPSFNILHVNMEQI